MNSESEVGACSSPDVDTESRGSSVSTGLREEYEDLLRYAVVTPITPSVPGTRKVEPKFVANGSQQQHYPSPVLPPRPHTPPPHASRGHLQPEISKVSSDISDPSDLQELNNQATPLLRPPPPFTAMNVQQHEAVPTSDASSMVSGSHDLPSESHDNQVEDESTLKSHDVDPEMTRLESQLDGWCLDLKRNVLAEFEQARIRMLERRQAELERERQQHGYELQEAKEQLEQYKELLSTYEQSIGRKDHVIANLTNALQKQKDRVELHRTFGSWKLRHTDDKRESFTTTLARRHYHKKVKGRVWGAWFGLIQSRWKQRVEKACQSKAEEVCVQLSGEYEEQLEAVHRSLEESQEEVRQLKAERDLYEENMKKAFMRGVCALNMEAMSMFRYHEPEQNSYHGNSNGSHGNDAAPQGHIGEQQAGPVTTTQNTTGHAQQTVTTVLPHSTTKVSVTTAPHSSTSRQSYTVPTRNLHVTTSANPRLSTGTAPGQSHILTRGGTPYAKSNPTVIGHQASNRKINGPKLGRGGVSSAPARHTRPEVVVQKH